MYDLTVLTMLQEHAVCDLPVAQTLGDQGDDLGLTGTQPVVATWPVSQIHIGRVRESVVMSGPS